MLGCTPTARYHTLLLCFHLNTFPFSGPWRFYGEPSLLDLHSSYRSASLQLFMSGTPSSSYSLTVAGRSLRFTLHPSPFTSIPLGNPSTPGTQSPTSVSLSLPYFPGGAFTSCWAAQRGLHHPAFLSPSRFFLPSA